MQLKLCMRNVNTVFTWDRISVKLALGFSLKDLNEN